jgi:hypothetical protein
MWTTFVLISNRGLLLSSETGLFAPSLLGLPTISAAQAAPIATSPQNLILVAIIIALGGLLLLAAAGALATIAFTLYFKRPQQQAPSRAGPPVVPEPEMPLSIETELSFSTGDPEDTDPDSIATEVFVRVESIPPDVVDTIDDTPGKLIATRRPK